MNFDYGTILTSALQITWKRKVFWALLTLPMLLLFAVLPFMFVFLFFVDGNISDSASLVLGGAWTLFIILLSIAGMVLHVIASSSVALGIVRLERGEGSLGFVDLLRDGFAYFWRELGVTLIVQLTFGLVFTAIFACMFVSTMVTIGMAAICWQPVILLMTPLMYLVMGVLESAYMAVIADDLGPVDAVKCALQIVREHIWKYIAISLIVYFGGMIVSSVILFPLFIPLFFLPFLLESGGKMDSQLFMAIAILFSCIFTPVMTLFSVVLQTLIKTTLGITYLRLTRPAEGREFLPQRSTKGHEGF